MSDPTTTANAVHRDPDALVERVARSAVASLVVTTLDGVIVYANDRALTIFGSPVNGMLGRSIVEFFPDESRNDVVLHLARLMVPGGGAGVNGAAANGTVGNGAVGNGAGASGPGSEPASWTTVGVSTDGRRIPIHVSADRIEHEGSAHCAFCIHRQAHDVAPSDDLSASGEQLRQFAYMASHDLGSPLAKIASLVRWLRDDFEAEAPADASQKTLESLSHAVERMAQLMNGLLDYARAGGPREPAVEVRVVDLLSEVVGLAEVPGEFEVTWPDHLPSIVCQPTPIRHTLLNLVNNAVEHHDRTSGRISIDCRFVGPGRVEFTVDDDGPGIPIDQRERIFNIFHTLGQSRRPKASGGIGLAIVKRLVQRAGGEIRALDVPGDRSAGEGEPGSAARGTRMAFTWTCNGH